MPTMANPSAPSSNGVNPSSSSSTPASTPYRSLSLSDLRDRSKIRVSSPNDYSAKSWLVNARRCASEARIADTQNRIEEAFVGYLRACGFFEMFLNHKSYPKIKSEGSGNPSWHEYTEFSQHRAEYLARAKELSKVLAERDVEKERYGHGHDHDHDHGLVSQHAEPARAQADLAQAQAQAQSQVSPPETQAAQATSPTDSSTDTKGGGSIAARLMALRGAGMEVGTNNKRFTRDLVTPVVKEDVHSPVIYEERENQREHEQGHGHGQGNGHGIHSDSSSRKDSMALPMEPTPAASRGGSSASGNTTNTTSNEGGILTPRLENMKLTNSEMNPNRTGSSVRSVRSIEKAQPQHLSSSPSLTADNFNNLNSSHNTHPSYLINHDNINHDKLNHYKNVDNLDKNSSPDNVNVNDDLNTFPSPSRPAITIPTSGNENERVRESCEHPSPPASLNILSPTYATAESPREQLHFGYSHEAGPTSPASHTQAQGQGQNQHSFSLNELDFRSPVPKPERQNSTGPGSGSGPGGGSDGGGHKLDHSPPRRPATREEDDVMAHFVSSFPSLDDFEENPVYSVPTSAQTAGSGSSKSQSQSQPQPQPRPDSRSNSRDGPIVVISTEEETEFGLPSLPSVPKSVPGSVSRSGTGAGAGLGPGPSPPSANELLAAGVPNRPSSLPPPHIPLSPSSTLNGQTSPLSTSPSNGLHSPFPAAKHPPPVPPHTHAHAHASVPVPSSSRPLPKPNLPYTNAITPAQLNEYLHNPALKILIIDTRTQEEFNKDYVGKDMDFGGRKVNIVWIDPTILLRHGLDSTKLESALALLPSAEQKAFIDRTQNDLVVIYDASSKGFPPKGAFPTAPSLLSSIIFENEFRKTLPRCPVLLVGGYEAWKEEIKLRGGKQSTRAFGRNLINGQEHGSRAPPPLIPPTKPLHSPSASLPGGADTSRLRRDGAIHRSPGYSRNITDNFGGAVPQSMAGVGSSYTSQPMITAYTPPNKSRSGSLSAYDHFNGGPSPPPQASIGPGLLARKRSDYIDHHGQPYTGYVGHSPKTSIDYPTPRSGPIPPPPVAVTPGLERHDSRPPHAPRSASIISFDGLSKLPDFDDMLYWNDVGLGISGLKNLGNTCYMNSTIQCLSATYPLARFFRDGSYKREINTVNPMGTKGDVAKAFATLISMLWQEQYTFLSPVTFRKSITTWAPQFSGSDQHDSQEFLSFLLDGLHEDLNRVQKRPAPVEMSPEREAALETLPPTVAADREWKIYKQRNDSFIVDLFQGQYRNRMECLTCHKTSTTYDAFMYLSLPLPPGKSRVVVQELIDAFVQTEILDKDDAWNCPRCKVPRRATKSLSIARLPPVLLIHLKRFSTKNGVFWDKSETPVIFPLKNLDLTRYMPDSTAVRGGDAKANDPRSMMGPFKYDLFAVSNHMGSLSSGHYTAFVNSSKGWQYCDDSKITRVQDKDVISKPAYILFYKRVHS